MKLIPNLHSEMVTKSGVQLQTCAVTNRGADPEGFIRTGNRLVGIDREVYISVAAAKEMGRMVGMYTQEDVDRLKGRLEALEAEYADALERLDDITRLHELEQKVAA